MLNSSETWHSGPSSPWKVNDSDDEYVRSLFFNTARETADQKENVPDTLSDSQYGCKKLARVIGDNTSDTSKHHECNFNTLPHSDATCVLELSIDISRSSTYAPRDARSARERSAKKHTNALPVFTWHYVYNVRGTSSCHHVRERAWCKNRNTDSQNISV